MFSTARGPEGKVRGTPQQIIDKYNQLARDAQLSNDRVATENFQQHAEHYLRLLSEAQREMEARREELDRQNRERQAERDRDRAERQERESARQADPAGGPSVGCDGFHTRGCNARIRSGRNAREHGGGILKLMSARKSLVVHGPRKFKAAPVIVDTPVDDGDAPEAAE